MTVRDIAMIHIRASGPVSQRSVRQYLIEQAPGIDARNAERETNRLMRQLIRENVIEVYDPDGRPLTYVSIV